VVQNVSRAWVRTGADPRPLHVRHAEVADALVKGRGSGVYPVSEDAIDRMRADLDRLKKPEVWDERFEGARIDFEGEIARHQQLRNALLLEQRNLERLGSIAIACFGGRSPPCGQWMRPPTQRMSGAIGSASGSGVYALPPGARLGRNTKPPRSRTPSLGCPMATTPAAHGSVMANPFRLPSPSLRATSSAVPLSQVCPTPFSEKDM